MVLVLIIDTDTEIDAEIDTGAYIDTDTDLSEFACASERHPWDGRGKVGSERQFVTWDTAANFRQISVSSRSWFLFEEELRGPPPKLALV